MAIDFPASPSLNDTFSSGGVTYTWDGTVWAASGSAAFVVASEGIDGLGDVDTSTVAPTDGQALVWDNAAGQWEPGNVAGGEGSTTIEYSGAAAWAQVAANASVIGSLNIASVTSIGTGLYSFVFSTPMPNAQYSVTGAGAAAVIPSALSANGFSVSTFGIQNGDLVQADQPFHIAVHALNALPPTGGTGADAWGQTGSSGTLNSGFNIASVTKSATGVYDYVFTTPMPTNAYAVVGTAFASSNWNVSQNSNTTNGFTLRIFDQNGNPRDAGHSVLVHATNASLPDTFLKEDILYVDGRYDATGVQKFDAGIQLGAAATDTLDDYEEGTFTPRFKTAGGELTSPTYFAQEGRYQKVGKIVHFRLRVSISSKGTVPAGYLQIDGLPFATETLSNGYQGAVANTGYCANFNSFAPMAAAGASNSTTFSLYATSGEGTTNAGNNYLIDGVHLQDGTDCTLSGFYVAA